MEGSGDIASDSVGSSDLLNQSCHIRNSSSRDIAQALPIRGRQSRELLPERVQVSKFSSAAFNFTNVSTLLA